MVVIEKTKCAPTRRDSTGGLKDAYTCYSHTTLKMFAESLNEHYKKKVIDVDVYPHKDKLKLFNTVKKYVKKYCDKKSETCWAKQPFMKTDEYTNELTFKPIRSKIKYDWLSNLDIDIVLKQNEFASIQNKNIENFCYLGTRAIDFQTYLNETNYSISEKYNTGFRNFGMVLNLSRQSQPGSHWVALMVRVDDRKKAIETMYFNSSGRNPPQEVVTYKDYVKKQMKRLNYKHTFSINKVRTQNGNSECGVYCINFCVNILNGMSFYETTRNTIDDETMNRYRDKFFRTFDEFNISKIHIPGHELGI
jgi:hypothetical protein